ncbi:cache domain-containing sensor histidine kinase [Paenibacillus sp. FSL H8-0034]|uniref:cache domain-containing sensor histidine kinase n=1 Tax=Paenibacillus sp. FSL H8-0034 TaxID=2954671 RepID=UPI0030F9A15F
MGLKKKAILFFVLLIMIPVLAVGWYSYEKTSSTIKLQVGRTLLELLKQNHAALNRVINLIDENSIKISTDSAIRSLTDRQMSGKHRLEDVEGLLGRYSSLNISQPRYTLLTHHYAEYGIQLNPANRLSSVIDIQQFSTPAWFSETIQHAGNGSFKVLQDWSAFGKSRNTLAYMRAIRKQSNADQAESILVASNLESVLQPDLESVQLPSGSHAYLTNNLNEVLVSTAADVAPGSLLVFPREVDLKNEGVSFVQQDDKQWLYITHYSSTFSTRLIYKVPADTLTAQLEPIRYVILTITCIYLVLMVLFVAYLDRAVLRPLLFLTRLTKNYTPGQKRGEWIKSRRSDEIGHLHDSFHHMTERLNELIEEKYIIELKEKEIRLMSLQSQITPHLLYNTLDSIYWYGMKGGVPEVAEMVRDLSMLMRIGLSKGKLITTLSEELLHVDSYVRLQFKRYKNSFQVHMDITEETRGCMVPKVIVQPLVENAIFHGIGKMDGEGELWIRTLFVDGVLQIKVEDNGFKPIQLDLISRILSEEDQPDPLKEKGYGIRNVNKRIQLHYGNEYGLTYFLRPGGGTIAVITLPVLREEEISC